MMGRSGLQTGEVPLVTNLEKAFDQATTKPTSSLSPDSAPLLDLSSLAFLG
jgi:hypothetical protein